MGVEGMDDAALIRISDRELLAVASDFVRGSGFTLFRLGYLSYFDVGYYLIIANISDIAAMGARPIAATTIVRYTNKLTDGDFLQILGGIQTAANLYNIEIIGGDIGSYTADVFSETVMGIVKSDEVLLRQNVKDKDVLCVTGSIGLPITALIYFQEARHRGLHFSTEIEELLLDSWRRPRAKVKEGLLLSERSIAHGCQDISDGLKATIDQMSKASGKTFTLEAERLPINRATYRVAEFLQVDPIHLALSASVDFELLFTMAETDLERATKLFKEHGCFFHPIGIVNQERENLLLEEGKKKRPLPGFAWNHQSGEFLKSILVKNA
jgi:thiamine-monophosphate kinase